MAITFPLTFPSIEPESIKITARSQTSATRSPFSGNLQVQAFQGQWWEMNMSFSTLERIPGESIAAFLTAMNAQEGTFLFGDPSAKAPMGSAAVTPGGPQVNGASQVGRELAVEGLPVDAVGYLLPGDYIQLGTGLNTHLHKILIQVDVNSLGRANLDIWPALRSSPADNESFLVSGTQGLWRLTNNKAGWDIDSPTLFSHRISAQEAL